MGTVFLIMPHTEDRSSGTFSDDEYYAPEAICRTREEAEVLLAYYNATRAEEMEWEHIRAALVYRWPVPSAAFLEVASLGAAPPPLRTTDNTIVNWWESWSARLGEAMERGEVTKEMWAAIGAQLPLYSIIEKNIEKPTDVIPKSWLEEGA